MNSLRSRGISRATLTGLVGALVALLASAVPAAAAGAPTVRLDAPALRVAAGDPVRVHVTVANPLAVPLRVLRADLPAGAAGEPLFDVRLDDAPVPYLGALAKRPAPTAADYLELAPGASIAYDVDLAASYAFARTGAYAVRLRAPAALADGAPVAGAGSNVLVLEVAGREAPAAKVRPLGTAPGPTYTGCTLTQQADLATALADAGTYASGASTYFALNRAGARYVKWFGVYDALRWATVRTHFSAIATATASAPVHFDCTCTSSFYAYVFASSPYAIYLCNSFWTAPATGTDSKAGTLIHELSHFTVVADTDDNVYGQSGAMNLAISNPTLAIANADSHEYFAENAPATADAAPALAAGSTLVTFAPTPPAQTSASATITLSSTGDVAVQVGTLAVTGPFVLSSDTCSSATVAPGSSCTVLVAFAPVADGAAQGSLAIPSDARVPESVALSGFGGDPPTDTTPPTIEAPDPGSAPARSRTVTASTDEGVLQLSVTRGVTCDGSLAFVAYAPVTFDAEADNGARVCLRAEDAAGNVTYLLSPPVAGIDRTPPSAPRLTATPPARSAATSATFAFSATDGSGAPTFRCSLDGATPRTCTSPLVLTGLRPGSHALAVVAVDRAGNAGASTTSPRFTVQAERLRNGGLDQARAGARRLPVAWTRGGRWSRRDGRTTATRAQGTASVLLTGQRGRAKSLAQAVPLVAATGDVIALSYRVRTSGQPVRGRCEARLALLAGRRTVSTRSLPCGSDAGFRLRTLSVVTPAATTRAVVTLVYARASGRAWFDDVHLVQ